VTDLWDYIPDTPQPRPTNMMKERHRVIAVESEQDAEGGEYYVHIGNESGYPKIGPWGPYATEEMANEVRDQFEGKWGAPGGFVVKKSGSISSWVPSIKATASGEFQSWTREYDLFTVSVSAVNQKSNVHDGYLVSARWKANQQHLGTVGADVGDGEVYHDLKTAISAVEDLMASYGAIPISPEKGKVSMARRIRRMADEGFGPDADSQSGHAESQLDDVEVDTATETFEMGWTQDDPEGADELADEDEVGPFEASRKTASPKYPNINVALAGEDGNAFAILGRVQTALRRGGVDKAEIDAFMAEAMSGDYDHLLQTVMQWVDVWGSAEASKRRHSALEVGDNAMDWLLECDSCGLDLTEDHAQFYDSPVRIINDTRNEYGWTFPEGKPTSSNGWEVDAFCRSCSEDLGYTASRKKARTASVRKTASRPLYEIADEIYRDWKNVNYGAKPYLDAMMSLDSINDMYYADTAYSVVAYFLSNASSWKGETAKRVKAELKSMMKKTGSRKTALNFDDLNADDVSSEDEATQLAIEWQNSWGGEDLSWGEWSDQASFFEELVDKFPSLREEWEENGIVGTASRKESRKTARLYLTASDRASLKSVPNGIPVVIEDQPIKGFSFVSSAHNGRPIGLVSNASLRVRSEYGYEGDEDGMKPAGAAPQVPTEGVDEDPFEISDEEWVYERNKAQDDAIMRGAKRRRASRKVAEVEDLSGEIDPRTGKPYECYESGRGNCSGKLQYCDKLVRCDKHCDDFYDRMEDINRRYPDSDVAPDWFDPMNAGERWNDDY